MNPLVQTRLEHIQDQLEQLREVLADNDSELRKQHGEKADLLQEQWSQRKEVTTLNRIAQEYDDLEAENEQLRTERSTIREHLGRILTHTKSLHKAHKP